MPPKRKSQDSDSDDSFVANDSDESVDDGDSDEDDRNPGGSGRSSSTAKINKAHWVPAGAPRCTYGMGCTRKNPQHFLDEAHPSKHPLAHGAGAPSSADLVPPGQAPCRFGLGCTRQNPQHFQDEAHPSSHPRVIAIFGAGKGSGHDSRGGGSLVPAGLPVCRFGLNCKRQNPKHFQEESHPSSHPQVAALGLNVTGAAAATPATLGGGDEEERKKERERQRQIEWEKAEKDRKEREKQKEQDRREKEERERRERERAREKEIEKDRREREREKEKTVSTMRQREEDGSGGEAGAREQENEQAPPLSVAFLPPAAAAELAAVGRERVGISTAEGLSGDKEEQVVPQKEVEQEETFPLTVLDLDAMGAKDWTDGSQALAMPLLCADEVYAVDPVIAAKAAMLAARRFLAKHSEVSLSTPELGKGTRWWVGGAAHARLRPPLDLSCVSFPAFARSIAVSDPVVVAISTHAQTGSENTHPFRRADGVRCT